MGNAQNENSKVEVKRADIFAFDYESNDKAPILATMDKLMKSEGTIGRVRDEKRNVAWRRLLNFSRDKVAMPDSCISPFLSAHFELCLAKALKNARDEADAKQVGYSIAAEEGLIQYLGTRTAVMKAFGAKEDKVDKDEI